MPRPFNPNSKYGRRKIRQEFQHRYHHEMTPEERSNNDTSSGLVIAVLAIGLFALICATCGGGAAVQYFK